MSSAWRRSTIVVAVILAIAGVGSVTAIAAPTGDFPDLKLTVSKFDGRNLHVEYINATGVYDRRRYEVAVQWYDAQRKPIGSRRWLPVPEVERGGVGILDTKYRTELSYRRSDGRIYGQRLSDYITTRPNEAALLRVMLDDGDRIPETDETNNEVFLPFALPGLQFPPPPPRPDLTITTANLTAQTLSLTYKNSGEIATSSGQPISLWFEWVENTGARLGDLYWADQPVILAAGRSAAVETPQLTFTRSLGNSTETIDFDHLLARAPENATHLKVILDGPNRIAESREDNNTALLALPPPLKPDLIIENAVLTNDRLTFTIANRGTAPASVAAYNVRFEWLRADGRLTEGHPYPPVYLPGGSNLISGVPGDVLRFSSTPADQRYPWLFQSFVDPPLDAVQLRLTVDAVSAAEESSESNNIVVIDRPRPQLPEAELLPDFIIEEATLAYPSRGSDPASGQLVYTIRNRGTGAAPHGELWGAHRWVGQDGEQKGDVRFVRFDAALQPGETVRFDSSGQRAGSRGREVAQMLNRPPVGSTQFEIIVDPWGYYREPDNNASNRTRIDRPLPDYVLEAVQLTQGRLQWELWNRAGGIPLGRSEGYQWLTDFPIRHEWLNDAGRTIAERITYARGSVSNARVTTFDNNAQPDNEFYRFFTTPPAGATRMRITVDPGNIQPERDEANNITIATFPSPVQIPDLTLRDARLADGVLTITTLNVGTAPAPRVEWELRWLSRQGAAIKTYRELIGTFDAGNKRTESYPYVNVRAFGVFRFLSEPPRGAVRLEVVVDPADAIAEQNEDNNTIRIDRGGVDLAFGADVEGRDGALSITVDNLGTQDARATDIWLMWFGAKGALPSSAAVDLPAITAQGTATVGVPLNQQTEASRILRDPPKDATRLRIFLDGKRAVAESIETNNDVMFDRVKLPTVPAVAPLVKDLSESAVPTAALAVTLSLDVIPAASTPSSVSSLPKTAWGAFVQLLRTIAMAIADNPNRPSDAYAGVIEARPGDEVRAQFTIKNVGTVDASGVQFDGRCPGGSTERSLRVAGKTATRSTVGLIGVGDIERSSSTLVEFRCSVLASALSSPTLRFSGAARADSRGQWVVSNEGIVSVVKPIAKEPVLPSGERPDLVVEGIGFLPQEEVIEGDGLPFSALFTAIVKNDGPVTAPPSRVRLRIDIGANGSWNLMGRTSPGVGSLETGASELAKWPMSWKAPVGAYVVEVCIDSDKKVIEADESNNCATERFSLAIGEEPGFEGEEVIDE